MASASLEKAAIPLFVAFLFGFLLQSSGGQQQTQAPKYYELRFQAEVDNSTIVKQETQQQIFKCQVRLAPQQQLLVPESKRTASQSRLRSLISPLRLNSQQQQQYPAAAANDSTNSNEPNKTIAGRTMAWPTNVSLTVDWFKDNQPLVGSDSSELVSIINMELRGAASMLAYGGANGSQQKNDKRNKSRIEVKNTSNGNQLKLTSRLKIGQLRPADSGHYKCLARATFQLPLAPASAASGQQQLITTAQVHLIEQWLESNSAVLSVVQQNRSTAVNKNMDGQQLNDVQHANHPSSKANTGRGLQQADHQEPKDGLAAGSWATLDQQSRLQAAGAGDNGTSNGNLRRYSKQSGGQLFDSADDEDLARQQPSNFISGGSMIHPGSTNEAPATGNTGPTNEDDDETSLRWRPLFPSGDQESGDISAGTGREFADYEPNEISIDANTDNNDSSWNGHPQQQQQNIRPHNHHNRAPNGLSSSSRHQWLGNSLAARDHHQQQQQQQQPSGATDKYFDSVDRLAGLAKLVHKIAPELGCYTASGEHYRGTLAQIADGRLCVSWKQAAASGSQQHLSAIGKRAAAVDFIFRAEKLDDIHHNHCRNPTMDPRGPWCFVHYEQDLDSGPASSASSLILISNRGSGGGGGGGGNNDTVTRYIQRQCSVAPCSEYLWLYIVAPPLGLLLLLTCLIILLARCYVRRKHGYLSAARRSKSPSLRFGGFGKLLLANGGKFAPKKLSSSSACSHKSHSYGGCSGGGGGRYLDDDIFEIVDDIDWSDGTNQSQSPKSRESLKFSAATTSGDDSDSPLQLQRPKQLNVRLPTNFETQARKIISNNKVGPVFATLRCQARNNLKTITGGGNQVVHGNTLSRLNKSSTFIEQRDLLMDSRQQPTQNCTDTSTATTSCSLSPKATSHSLTSPKRCNNSAGQQASSSLAMANSGHLISCSSTTEDICCREKHTSACDLPLISPESISIATNQQQPLYESKFSQVRLALVKRQRAPADEDQSSQPRNNLSLDIGAQVALCSLKSSAHLEDESIFEPANLRLRNLNHLNILKLIGYSLQTENEIGLRQTTTSCSLIFDMGQLVDLNDWLRQQSKDQIVMSCEPAGELGTRRNLTCFAKQIALAIDYLHDRGIVYKDLACRNCFLDPSKMLVKLASFNLEFAAKIGDDEQLISSLRSMIRPKYLLDYYVIDSRPSESQLLPLSWIPLESILFNKFNMQTDVWSFGCLLYELFSLGEVAYFGYSSKQVIDAVRSNLMPPQPLLCPNGIYKLMCKCLSDIPSMRPNVKQIYEQLNLNSGQCSSFLDHHLCSLATTASDEQQQQSANHQMIVSTNFMTNNSNNTSSQGSISKTKSYANIRNFIAPTNMRAYELEQERSSGLSTRPEVGKLPLSRSINLTSTGMIGPQSSNRAIETNHYDEPVVNTRK